MKTRGWALLLLLSLPLVSAARDLNRQRYLLGERASGMGGALVALGGDAAASYYNPAGLASLKARGISLSASAYQLSSESHADALLIPQARGQHQGGSEGRRLLHLPLLDHLSPPALLRGDQPRSLVLHPGARSRQA